MLVAENLIKCHAYYRGLSELWKQQKVDPRDRRCRIANRRVPACDGGWSINSSAADKCGVAKVLIASICWPSCKSFIAFTRRPSSNRSETCTKRLRGCHGRLMPPKQNHWKNWLAREVAAFNASATC